MPLIPFGEYRPDVTAYDQAFTGAVLDALPGTGSRPRVRRRRLAHSGL